WQRARSELWPAALASARPGGRWPAGPKPLGDLGARVGRGGTRHRRTVSSSSGLLTLWRRLLEQEQLVPGESRQPLALREPAVLAGFCVGLAAQGDDGLCVP